MLDLWLWTAMLIRFSLAIPSAVQKPRNAAADPSRFIFVFGDSYTTTGFNASIQPQPSVDHQLGNPQYPGATLSGGENWIDVVVYNRSQRSTVAYNYAVGGNTVNETQIRNPGTPPPGPIHDFIAQEAEFEKLAKTNTIKRTANNTLFIAWFGINDIATQVTQNRGYDQATSILAPDIDDYFGLLRRLYVFGARNFITILVPPIYRSALYGYGNSSKAPEAQQLTQYWNTQMKNGVTAFQKQYADSNSQVVDPSPTFNHILDNPHQYGAPNSTCYSYPDGQPCLWHDFIHPGLVIQKAFGNVMGDITSRKGF